MNFTDERQWDRWLSAMKMEFMSSEESGQEGDEEVIIVKTMPWRSDQVNRLIKQLDQKTQGERSSKARRQVIPRVFLGDPSSRIKPVDDSLPSWLLKE